MYYGMTEQRNNWHMNVIGQLGHYAKNLSIYMASLYHANSPCDHGGVMCMSCDHGDVMVTVEMSW